MHGDNEEDVPDLWREHYEARVKEAQAQRDAYYRQFYGAPMSEPSPKLERYGHIGESGLTRIRVQTGVDLVGRSQYAEVAKCVNGEWASELVRIHNAHAALVEACEAASEALYAATACGAQSRHEQEQVNEARVKIESALSKARPKGKE